MKASGSGFSRAHHKSAAGVFAALFVVLCLFVAPSLALASTPTCGNPDPIADGYLFSNDETDGYSPDGLLIQHFKNLPLYTDGRTFKLSWAYFDDECNPASTGFPLSTNVTMPVGVTDWSIRFVSPTAFDVWDDQHNTIIASSTTDRYPSYTSIQFSGLIDGGASYLQSRTLKIQAGGEPPLVSGTLQKDPVCPSMMATGYYFDPSYEQAEYVDHLLRLHVRLKTPYNDGPRLIRLAGLSVDASCDRDAQIVSPQYWATINPPHLRYYSFRMTTPTHWILWNDEDNVQIICPLSSSYACEGEVAPSTPYVSWYGYVDAGVTTLLTTPYRPTDQTCTQDCNDNVLFLPGIEGSRLYAPGLLSNQVWEPIGVGPNPVSSLDMDNPSSMNSVYTRPKDVIGKAYGLYGVYGSFVATMDTMKNTNHLIADWEPIAYDWRLDYQDLLTYGHETGDGRIYYRGTNAATTSDPYIVQELKRLAASSRTGKVTIIAHSNGGLVAKELMTHPDLAQYVDKIILVATPQLGTPKAIGSILHGYDQGLPIEAFQIFFTDADARFIGQNMPMAYNLLPSVEYFNHVQDSVVTFDPATMSDWKFRYIGPNLLTNGITSGTQLKTFMTDSSRSVPGYYDLATPGIASPALFDNAINVHERLDNWTPPPNVQLITVAGWGNDTLSTIEYRKASQIRCQVYAANGSCAVSGIELVQTYNPKFVIDGDGTVVESSAQWANDAPSTRYWVDLMALNTLTTSAVSHANILEISSVQTLLTTFITNQSTSTLPQFISMSRPTYSGDAPRLHFILHSPLTLGFTDTQGNHTGATATTTVLNIPGVVYERFGEVQWLSVPKNLAGQVVMHGTGSGSFALDIEEQNGNIVTATTTFAAVPSSTSTIATIMIDPTRSPTASSTLVVDFDGDGDADTTLQAKQGAIVLPKAKAPMTVTANDQTMVLGGAIPTLTDTLSGFVNGDTATSSDVAGAPDCVTTATASSSVGTYPIVCTIGSLASDSYEFITFVTGTFSIVYRWDGFLQPINDIVHQIGQSLSVFKAGSTIPVKLQLKSTDGTPVQATTVPIWLTPQKGSAMSAPVDESIYFDPVTSGNAFKWDPTSQQYVYNWSTKSLSAGSWYRAFVKFDDGTIQSVLVGLK